MEPKDEKEEKTNQNVNVEIFVIRLFSRFSSVVHYYIWEKKESQRNIRIIIIIWK